jgi:hypothetical protein
MLGPVAGRAPKTDGVSLVEAGLVRWVEVAMHAWTIMNSKISSVKIIQG